MECAPSSPRGPVWFGVRDDSSALSLRARLQDKWRDAVAALPRFAATFPPTRHFAPSLRSLCFHTDHPEPQEQHQPNIIQHRIRFNRAETATIAAGGWGGVVGSFTCGIMAPVCAVASGALAYNAGVAQNSNPKRCVQVTATNPGIIPGIIWWVDTYAGGPCR